MKKKLNCILLIDDDAATNFLSNIIIGEAECTLHIKTRQTAKDALNYISDSSDTIDMAGAMPYPDLIFLDINMPSMDGWEFLGKYKELTNKPHHIPIIIMLSSSVDPNDKLKALNIPEVSDIHSKPMTPEIINSIIIKYFPSYVE
ncbi:MAG: response regulator [Ferruginibacter sp.]